MLKLTKIILAGMLCVIGFASTASAGLILVNSRAALGGTDFFDWSQLEPNNAVVPNGSGVTSDGGLDAIVSIPNGDMRRIDQGIGVNDWNGNFANGDALLKTTIPGTLTINFDGLVGGAGAQIQANLFGAFMAEISAFDSGGLLLGSFLLDGNSTIASDNSAIFIGILSDAVDIASISFNIPSGSDFAINQLDITNSTATVPVPAPGVLILFGIGILGMGALRRRQKS